MRSRWLAIFIFLILAVLPALGDGGTLYLKSIPPDDKTALWLTSNNGFGSEQQAEFSLEDGTRLEGYSFSFSDPNRPILNALTSSDPIRFFVDSNDDGALQAQEGYLGEIDEDSPYLNKGYLFHSVAFPLVLGNATEETPPHSIHADVTARIDSYITSFAVKRFLNRFEGTLRIGNEDYPALIVFRSIQSHANETNTLIAIDLNRDNRYLPLDDLWFSTQGIAYLNQSPCNVSTAFHGNEAEITISPYTGALGTLKLTGEGILRTVAKGTSDFVLPIQEDWTYALPVGNYQFTKIWLTPGDNSDTVFQWPIQSFPDSLSFVIQDNQTTERLVGGPLNQSVKVSINPFSGTANLNYQGCVNENRITFISKKISNLLDSQTGNEAPPTWEIRNGRGQAVRSGHFEYG